MVVWMAASTVEPMAEQTVELKDTKSVGAKVASLAPLKVAKLVVQLDLK
jgi:hypothetical protein